jgi:hypothetical protein
MKRIEKYKLTDAMHNFIRDCDGDELARIAEEMFGGKWTPRVIELKNKNGLYFPIVVVYDIEFNENYNGAFGEFTNAELKGN